MKPTQVPTKKESASAIAMRDMKEAGLRIAYVIMQRPIINSLNTI